ncbi:MAG: phosphatidate cytidylyltransferase [Actinobacteria bacterium]|nr:phosphatidate cytidylyltransferase [Actinomycetota bacterium]
MDDQRRSRPDDDEAADPAEGVRIIGPAEAAEAIERGDVAPRRSDDQLRFGDRPPAPPAGPRPALRFPLDASADPTRIERPPVQPAPDPVTGPVELPHWTEPPTGEVPAVLIGDDGPLLGDGGDDLDAWSSFATSTPRWRDADDDWADDGYMETLAADGEEVRVGALGDQDAEPSHEEYFSFDDLDERVGERTAEAGAGAPDAGWADDEDWSASEAGEVPESWDDEAEEEPVVAATRVGTRPEPSSTFGPTTGGGERNMPVAIGVGVGLAVLAAVLLKIGPGATMLLVVAVLALSAIEYFAVLRKVGWESATPLGVAACALFPLAVYWRGPIAFPLITFLVLAALLAWYLVGAGGHDPRVLEGSGATLLGVIWVGGLGSSAAAMLAVADGRALLLVAVLTAVAYDVGGLFIGKSMGHRPVSAASPNKTFEGLVGGMAVAFIVAIVAVGMLKLGPWDGVGAALILGIGAAVAAPLGDLCQSLLKRDLGVKDMSSILPGHGGVLDRFDSMLFVLPTVFWLAVTIGHIG